MIYYEYLNPIYACLGTNFDILEIHNATVSIIVYSLNVPKCKAAEKSLFIICSLNIGHLEIVFIFQYV